MEQVEEAVLVKLEQLLKLRLGDEAFEIVLAVPVRILGDTAL